jgi:hypothetical protein
MKTPDTVSKIRQKLYKEQGVWNQQIMILSNIAINSSEEDKPKILEKLRFYNEQLLKCTEALDRVKRVCSKKQSLAGWR